MHMTYMTLISSWSISKHCGNALPHHLVERLASHIAHFQATEFLEFQLWRSINQEWHWHDHHQYPHPGQPPNNNNNNNNNNNIWTWHAMETHTYKTWPTLLISVQFPVFNLKHMHQQCNNTTLGGWSHCDLHQLILWKCQCSSANHPL